jgi:hypothetical protein
MARSIAVGALAIVACWSGRAAPPASEAPEARDVSGSYWCSIDQRGVDYPRYPCLIKRVHGRLMLAKLGGAERIRGAVALDGRPGFAFTGELYCAWGDCTAELRGRFEPAGRGWIGTLRGPLGRDQPIVVHLVPAPANAFAGQGYGGDGYGDPFDLDRGRRRR